MKGDPTSRYHFALDNGRSISGSPTFGCHTLNDHNKFQNGPQFQGHLQVAFQVARILLLCFIDAGRGVRIVYAEPSAAQG